MRWLFGFGVGAIFGRCDFETSGVRGLSLRGGSRVLRLRGE